MTAFFRLSTWALGAVLVLLAGQASALTSYGSYAGPTVTFTTMQESSSSGDPEPLFGAPTGLGDQLLFFSPTFIADANPTAGTFDHTGSQFQAVITGNTTSTVLTDFNLTEFGDIQIGGAGGTAATGTYAALVGFLTVTHDTSGPIAPVVIPFIGTFAPSDTADYVNDFGTSVWSASVSIDITAYVPNANRFVLSLDNDLYAYSEITDVQNNLGTSAKIQKKVTSGPAIIVEVIPEPGTAILLGSGLVIMSVRGRRNRSA